MESPVVAAVGRVGTGPGPPSESHRDPPSELSLLDRGLYTLHGAIDWPQAPQLRRLIAHSNHLTHIDVDLRSCSGLVELNLSSNDLRSLRSARALRFHRNG
jgi:Leucine-rich repeat (LRR) protein